MLYLQLTYDTYTKQNVGGSSIWNGMETWCTNTLLKPLVGFESDLKGNFFIFCSEYEWSFFESKIQGCAILGLFSMISTSSHLTAIYIYGCFSFSSNAWNLE